MKTTLFQTVSGELRALGLVIQQAPGYYSVNFRNGSEATEYQTENLDDALHRGKEMAAHSPPLPEPPLGPTGSRSRRRAIMIAHNNRIAARRRKKKAAGKG